MPAWLAAWRERQSQPKEPPAPRVRQRTRQTAPEPPPVATPAPAQAAATMRAANRQGFEQPEPCPSAAVGGESGFWILATARHSWSAASAGTAASGAALRPSARTWFGCAYALIGRAVATTTATPQEARRAVSRWNSRVVQRPPGAWEAGVVTPRSGTPAPVDPSGAAAGGDLHIWRTWPSLAWIVDIRDNGEYAFSFKGEKAVHVRTSQRAARLLCAYC